MSPISVSHLSQDRRTITVPVNDESLTITYRPGGLTPEVEDQLRELTDTQRGGATLVTFLLSCLVDWDLLDEEGRPLPISHKTLSRLPTLFLAQLVGAISQDMRPNLMSAGSSGAGLSQRDD